MIISAWHWDEVDGSCKLTKRTIDVPDGCKTSKQILNCADRRIAKFVFDDDWRCGLTSSKKYRHIAGVHTLDGFINGGRHESHIYVGPEWAVKALARMDIRWHKKGSKSTGPSRKTLLAVVEDINEILWPGGDPDHEWEVEDLEAIADVLEEAGLAARNENLRPVKEVQES